MTNQPDGHHAPKPSIVWTARLVSALPVLVLGMSAFMKLSHAPEFVSMWTSTLGFPEALITPVAIIELVCLFVYVIPATAVLGAVLVSGYLGGAICAHLRVEDVSGVVAPLVVAVLAWVGLFLRDVRLRELLPLRKP